MKQNNQGKKQTNIQTAPLVLRVRLAVVCCLLYRANSRRTQNTRTSSTDITLRIELTPLIGYSAHLQWVAESDLKPKIAWTKDAKLSLPVESNVLLNGTLLIENIKKSHEGTYICKATNALSTIEAKVKINSHMAASCSMIRKYFSRESGNYEIDPDGPGGLVPFTIYCDMSDKNGFGVTVVSHDSESSAHVYTGTKQRDIHYTGASLSQLASLTRVSSHCEQFIKYECYNSHLFGKWWESRDSIKMTYWGGASPRSGNCACGMTNSCVNPSHRCNCDQDDNVWREDSGLLTDKTHLPVTRLYFRDVGGIEEGYRTLSDSHTAIM